MKIQCDVCEKASATVICCADEAALCAKCDIEVHAANKLASKHQRLLLQCFSNKLPSCDICQEKTAFIFCVEDRALFCRDCDEPVHSAGSLSANHQRLSGHWNPSGFKLELLPRTLRLILQGHQIRVRNNLP
ncbi:hypothetical protein OIU76_028704 [Salix suchowensis]|nr:hypothetical protein OIU76_028704 [Salix suchowensis]